MENSLPSRSWKRQVLSVLQYVLMVAVAGALLIFSFSRVNVGALFQDIVKADLFWISLSVFLSFIALVIRGYRWRLLIRPLGYSPSIDSVIYAVSIGYLANLAFPRLGEITRCGSLRSTEKIPVAKLLGTVVVERIVDVLSLLICILILAIIEFKRLGNFLYNSFFVPIIAQWNKIQISPLLFVIILSAILILTFFITRAFKRSSRKSVSGWKVLVDGFVKGISSIRALENPWYFVLLSVIIWVLYFFGVYVCLFAFPFTEHFDGKVALFLLVAGGLGMSAPVQGGIGAYHLLVTQGLLIYSLSEQNGLAFATLLHSLNLILVLSLGSLSLLLIFLKKRGVSRKMDLAQ